MRKTHWFQVTAGLKDQRVPICSEGKSEAGLAEAIGELERCKVRYVVLPTREHLDAYRAMFKASEPSPKHGGEAIMNSLREADQVCQAAQIEVDAILTQVLDLILTKVEVRQAVAEELEALCGKAKGVMYSAMNEINFIAGEHGEEFVADAASS